MKQSVELVQPEQVAGANTANSCVGGETCPVRVHVPKQVLQKGGGFMHVRGPLRKRKGGNCDCMPTALVGARGSVAKKADSSLLLLPPAT